MVDGAGGDLVFGVDATVGHTVGALASSSDSLSQGITANGRSTRMVDGADGVGSVAD